MSNFNLVILMGRLTRDVELRFTPSGKAVAKLSLAINRNWKTETGEKKEEVTFVECDVFGKQAETISQYCKKGSQLHVNGRLKLDSWDDKQTGQKRSRLGVVLEGFQFIGGKSEGDVVEKRTAAPTPKAETTAQQEDPHDDVPFS